MLGTYTDNSLCNGDSPVECHLYQLLDARVLKDVLLPSLGLKRHVKRERLGREARVDLETNNKTQLT